MSAATGSPQPGDERVILVQHPVAGFSDDWVIWEGPVPEAAWHERAVRLLLSLLEYWVTRTERDAAVFSNLAVRVSPDRPAVGISPDVILVEPSPPGSSELSSLKLWEPGHAVPALVVEVVSPGHPGKDYAEIPDQCAALGVRELVVFDPMGVGPKALGKPTRLSLWRKTEEGDFRRAYAGDEPCASAVLGAYFVFDEEQRSLRISDDLEGRSLWPTAEEAERAAKERALARIAELEQELARRGN